jgi:hypothetical protein
MSFSRNDDGTVNFDSVRATAAFTLAKTMRITHRSKCNILKCKSWEEFDYVDTQLTEDVAQDIFNQMLPYIALSSYALLQSVANFNTSYEHNL